MKDAVKNDLRDELQELLNENEWLLEDIITKSANGKFKFNQDHSSAIVDLFFESIINTTVKHKKLKVIGFGNFEVVERKGKKGRNPQTGEGIWIEPTKVPKFSPGKTFKDRVK